MSDAFTDIQRDNERARCYERFLLAFIDYFKSGGAKVKLKKQLYELAEETDEIPRGFHGGKTALVKELDADLERFRAKDYETWRAFLERHEGNDHYDALLSVSPLAKSA